MPVRNTGFDEFIAIGGVAEQLIKRQSMNLGVQYKLPGAYFIFDLPH